MLPGQRILNRSPPLTTQRPPKSETLFPQTLRLTFLIKLHPSALLLEHFPPIFQLSWSETHVRSFLIVKFQSSISTNNHQPVSETPTCCWDRPFGAKGGSHFNSFQCYARMSFASTWTFNQTFHQNDGMKTVLPTSDVVPGATVASQPQAGYKQIVYQHLMSCTRDFPAKTFQQTHCVAYHPASVSKRIKMIFREDNGGGLTPRHAQRQLGAEARGKFFDHDPALVEATLRAQAVLMGSAHPKIALKVWDRKSRKYWTLALDPDWPYSRGTELCICILSAESCARPK